MRSFRGLYGAGPLHALGLAACFAIAGYAALRIGDHREALVVAIWFGGAILAHDAVLFPLYSVAGQVAARLPVRGGPRRYINYVRVPVILSGLLLIVYFPLILQLGPESFERAAGEPPGDRFLEAWLAITGGLFAASALAFGAGLARMRRT